MRKIEFEYYGIMCGESTRRWHKLIGKFHQWGSETSEDKNGHISVETVGIVEAENGQVYLVSPARIKFTSNENS